MSEKSGLNDYVNALLEADSISACDYFRGFYLSKPRYLCIC